MKVINLLVFLSISLDSFKALSYERFAKLPKRYEASGLAYDKETKSIFTVSDKGRVTKISEKGDVVESWKVKGDLEGITIVPEIKNTVFVLDEDKDRIIQFNYAEDSIVRKYDLSEISQDRSIDGEALAYMPGSNGEKGKFLIGSQSTGEIFIYEFNLESLSLRLSQILPPKKNLYDISGLLYDEKNKTVWAIYDKSDKVGILDADTFETKYLLDLPGSHQEGIIINDCKVYIAEDKKGDIYVFDYSAFESGPVCEVSS